MQFIQGYSRHQTILSTLADKVKADNPLRLMTDFVNKLKPH
jgi:hypothetical protein